MRPIDSLLGILIQQGGNELRLIADRRPRMFDGDTELPLTMPAMSADRIQQLLADLWTANEAELTRRGRLELSYRNDELGLFAFHLQQSAEAGLEVSFSCTRAWALPAPAEVTPSERPEQSLPPPLTALLTRAQTLGASDIHLSPGRAPVVRINGALAVLDDAPPCDAAALLEGRPLGEASVDRAFEIPGVGRLRVNVYRSTEGVCAAVRLLRREAPELAELNLPAQVAGLTELPHGLVLACG